MSFLLCLLHDKANRKMILVDEKNNFFPNNPQIYTALRMYRLFQQHLCQEQTQTVYSCYILLWYGHKRTEIQYKENKAPVVVKHFIVCDYVSGNSAELGIGMLLVMNKLTYDNKDTYQEAIHWMGQQSRFKKVTDAFTTFLGEAKSYTVETVP